MIQILVVDDQSIVRYGIVQLIHEGFPAVEVDVAEDVNEMVNCLLAKSYHIVLLDINIPGGNHFSMLDIIRLRQPKVKVLIFSGYDESIYAHRYISEGAHGYLSKLASEKELKVAIQTILQGNIYLSQNMKASLVGVQEGRPNENLFHSLSNRELEVMNLLIEGLRPVDISSRLNLQLSTVSTYKRRIFEKLHVENVVELIQKSRLFNT